MPPSPLVQSAPSAWTGWVIKLRRDRQLRRQAQISLPPGRRKIAVSGFVRLATGAAVGCRAAAGPRRAIACRFQLEHAAVPRCGVLLRACKAPANPRVPSPLCGSAVMRPRRRRRLMIGPASSQKRQFPAPRKIAPESKWSRVRAIRTCPAHARGTSRSHTARCPPA